MVTVLEDVQRSKAQLAERLKVQDLLRQLYRLKSELGGKKKSLHNDQKAFEQKEGEVLELQENLQDSLRMAKEAVNQSDRQIDLILEKSKVLSNGSKSAETIPEFIKCYLTEKISDLSRAFLKHKEQKALQKLKTTKQDIMQTFKHVTGELNKNSSASCLSNANFKLAQGLQKANSVIALLYSDKQLGQKPGS